MRQHLKAIRLEEENGLLPETSGAAKLVPEFDVYLVSSVGLTRNVDVP